MTTSPESGASPAAPIPDLDSVIARYQERQRRRAELRPANRTALFDALAAVGITTIVVSFDGYGDSGQIEGIQAHGVDGEIALPSTHVALAIACCDEDDSGPRCLSLEQAIEDAAYDALADLHGGWENNEGAYGEFVFDTEKRAISLDYHERYTATEDYVHQL
jgi:hypothetical protein